MNEQPPQVLLSDDQLVVLLVGTIVPLGTYLFNRFAPWNNETVKGIVQVVLTAVAGTLYTWWFTDFESFADFLQQAFSAVVAGLFAHNILWKPSGLNLVFGANRPGNQQLTRNVTA